MSRRRLALLWSTVVFSLVACSGGRSSPGGATPSAPDRSGPVGVAAAIQAFDNADLSRSLFALTASALADPEAARAAALATLSSSDADERFAAVYALTLSASTANPASIDALTTLTTSPDVTERLLAAGTLAGLGEVRGLEVLVAALGVDEPMRNVEPPMPAWRFALSNLRLFVPGAGLGVVETATDARGVQPSLAAILAGPLRWDPVSGTYARG